MHSQERARQQATLGAVRNLIFKDAALAPQSKAGAALACMTEACVEGWSFGYSSADPPILLWEHTARSAVQKTLARDRVWLSDIEWGVGDSLVLMAASCKGSSVQSPTSSGSLELSLHTVVSSTDSNGNRVRSLQGTSSGHKLKEHI